MATANGKKGYRIKFELSISGLLGVVVVCFCVFLWMFLLGLWAGQTGMISGLSFSAPPAIPAASQSGPAKNKVIEAPEVAPPPEVEPAPAPGPTPEPAVVAPPPETTAAPAPAEIPVAPAFYAIQVGAFRDSRYVEEALQKWRALGYEPFFRPPSGAGEHLNKVYLGHFSEAATARKEAEILARKEEITPVVALIPGDPAKRP